MDKQHVLIQTRMGKVKGLENAKTQKFLGIRYAYAARYEAPQPYHYETEEIDATNMRRLHGKAILNLNLFT